MNVFVLLLGAALTIWGVISLVKPDWAWSLTELGNSMRGVQSERTDLWGVGNAIGGVVLIVVGLVLVVLSFSVR
jgi:hypothetical protein